MHLLYLNYSGSSGNANERYIVVGGVSLHETQTRRITKVIDEIAKNITPDIPIEFHASEILARRCAPWNKMTKEEVKDVVKSILKVLSLSSDSTHAFACAVHKASYPSKDSLKLAFLDMYKKFDIYLCDINREDIKQRGLSVLDDSFYETTLHNISGNNINNSWGKIKGYADTPVFISSKASRVMQLADHIAYAVFRKYNNGDSEYFDIIASKFYSCDNIVHGLVHKYKLQ